MMATKFEDGPLAGRYLSIRLCPLFLRACVDAEGNIDALDQLTDEPKAVEQLYAYRREGEVSTVFVDGTDKQGRRRGWVEQSARYRLCLEQPDDGTMRDRVRWQEWCQVAFEREQDDSERGSI